MSFKIHNPENSMMTILSRIANQIPKDNISYSNSTRLSGNNIYTLNLDPWANALCSEFNIFAQVTGDANEMYTIRMLVNGITVGIEIFGLVPATSIKSHNWTTSVGSCEPTSVVQIEISSMMSNNFEIEIGDLNINAKLYSVNPYTETKSLTIA